MNALRIAVLGRNPDLLNRAADQITAAQHLPRSTLSETAIAQWLAEGSIDALIIGGGVESEVRTRIHVAAIARGCPVHVTRQVDAVPEAIAAFLVELAAPREQAEPERQPSAAPLYTHHPRIWDTHRYVYPVLSRRSRGVSIGINLNPDKVCNFDCVYCSVDRRGAKPRSAPIDLDVLHAELDRLFRHAISGALFAAPPFDQTPPELRRINDFAFSGDGEPTSSAEFPAACRIAEAVRERHGRRDVKLVVITNATLFDRLPVRDAFAFLDACPGPTEIWAKLDAGTQGYYASIERSRVPLARVCANLREAARLRPLVIQSLFLRLHGQPPPESEIAAYVQRLRDLIDAGGKIARVQIYTLARRPAEDFVQALPSAAVDAIADQVRALGVAVEAFYAPE